MHGPDTRTLPLSDEIAYFGSCTVEVHFWPPCFYWFFGPCFGSHDEASLLAFDDRARLGFLQPLTDPPEPLKLTNLFEMDKARLRGL